MSANENNRPPAWALPLDTTLEAARVHTAVLRKLGDVGRAAITAELCQIGRDLARQGIRNRHPEYDDRQVHLACCRMMLGDELFFQAFPGQQIKI